MTRAELVAIKNTAAEALPEFVRVPDYGAEKCPHTTLPQFDEKNWWCGELLPGKWPVGMGVFIFEREVAIDRRRRPDTGNHRDSCGCRIFIVRNAIADGAGGYDGVDSHRDEIYQELNDAVAAGYRRLLVLKREAAEARE